jgi:chromosome segregation ATPase
VLIIATVVIAGAAFWFAWWLRANIARGAIDALTKTIDTMNQRLEFAQDQLTAIKSKLAETEKTVAAQANEIAQLRDQGFAGVEGLAQSNNAIQSSLTDLATSTTILDRTFSNIREWANAFNKPMPSAG